LRFAAVALCAALVAACATAPTSTAPVLASVEPEFDASGRLSARHGSEAVAVHFEWKHAPALDEFDVSTPLGQTVARMRRDGKGVRVERPNEAPAEYPDWASLTTAVLGVSIPVNGLAAWIQGAPDPQSASDIERDTSGRPLVLRQQGWEIVYAYGADGRPTRLVMRYPASEPIEVRVVVDRFATPR
jgi:outer membrane lipoprotein LolB